MKPSYRYGGFLTFIIFILVSVYFITSIVFDYISHNGQFKGILYSPIFQSDYLFIFGMLSIPILGATAFITLFYSQLKNNDVINFQNENLSTEEDWQKPIETMDEAMPTLDEELNEIIKQEDIDDYKKDELCFFKLNHYLSTVAGIYYILDSDENIDKYISKYFYMANEPTESISFEWGEGIVGEVAKQKTSRILWDIPGEKIVLKSGLGKAVPHILFVVPIFENKKAKTQAVIELAFFEPVQEKLIKEMEIAVKVLKDKLINLNQVIS